MLRAALAAIAVLTVLHVDVVESHSAHAQRSGSDQFYNYYVGGPNGAGGHPAQLYVSPRPTPPMVGHTYMTYQGLYPHEFMYKHRREYTTCNADGSSTRTRISYRPSLWGQSRVHHRPFPPSPKSWIQDPFQWLGPLQ
jgi:hypothetical protein